jgi:hypothetical protein
LLVTNKKNFDEYNSILSNLHPFHRNFYEILLPLSLFAIAGAFGWAIRGTQGWGGTAGGIIAGLIWGFLFYFLAALRGIDARWQTIHLGIGIGIGGLNAYGQLLGWIQGNFSTGTGVIPINPWIGYFWLLIIGLEWGGNAAIILCWSLMDYPNRTIQIRYYVLRFFGGFLGGLFGYYLIKLNPTLFFPHYNIELYGGIACAIQCTRTMTTLPLLGSLFGIFCGLFIVEILLKNRLVFKITCIMAIGFGVIFPVAAYLWFILPQSSFDWWKVWEESIGLIGGLSIGCVFLLIMKDVKFSNESGVKPIESRIDISSQTKIPIINVVFSLTILIFYSYGWSAITHTLVMVFGLLDYVNESVFYPERFILQIAGIIPMIIIYFFWLRNTIRNNVLTPFSNHIFFHFKSWLFGFTYISICAFIAIQGSNVFYFYLLFYFLIFILSFKAIEVIYANSQQRA